MLGEELGILKAIVAFKSNNPEESQFCIMAPAYTQVGFYPHSRLRFLSVSLATGMEEAFRECLLTNELENVPVPSVGFSKSPPDHLSGRDIRGFPSSKSDSP